MLDKNFVSLVIDFSNNILRYFDTFIQIDNLMTVDTTMILFLSHDIIRIS